MFDAGTNSAETPRTGAPAPSLNSMGAEARAANGPVVRRLHAAGESGSGSSSAAAGGAGASEYDRTPADDGELFERLVDALEQRVLDELERRGHRHAPGVF